MSRTDDDTWDITEGVGATALSVARARATETGAECPLYLDPYAHFFVEAAVEAGWRSPFLDEDPVRAQAMAAYIASRTKFFDDFFTAAGANGLDQAVILAAGLDTRAWRLPWISGTTVYEIDQPKVLEFKERVLAEHQAKPAARYAAVAVDLRHDWPKALRQNGFDPSIPTAWSAEGLLPYLPAAAQDALFQQIDQLSAPGSRLSVEAFGETFYSAEQLARRQERMAQARRDAVAAGGPELPDVTRLWYMEARTDVEKWLTERGWEVTATSAVDLMAHYKRPAPDDLEDPVPDTVLLDAHKL
ncbi:SAM-dependent methyltransferase [Mycolicibacterium aromaticivorans JS19b1 = JCM 16368]|uniref:S-adenosyl-L-methionine-dependent methyltransferase n=1 Tax=Mycolicibacterium aromaticivorans JS19b1 = JCM 16368 TaxID=1440774 RepID=A0A064CP17_9MYCO|nr:SAM-dependent methyltransferase [Mycolicibacterium aromaticivorans]KDF00464.1 SAM-dependent methyltransferase [Mycolicibacterium aromaticivorans JS19b1 = JCM 16368]